MLIQTTNKKTIEVEEVVDAYHECDKCKSKIIVNAFDAHECYLKFTKGNQYPEGGAGVKFKVEFCEKCANETMEHLKSQGCRINEENWDY